MSQAPTHEVIELLLPTPLNRAVFAILCAQQVYAGKSARWDRWAADYLSGKDRTATAASGATRAASAASAAHAAYAAYSASAAASAAAYATRVTYAAHAAAAYATYATYDAAAAVAAEIDFAALVAKALAVE